MADNTTLDPGAGGDTIATDDVGGVKYQRVKLDGGGDGLTEPLPGTTADGLLVNLGANNDVTVAGVATAANQATGNTSLATIAGAVSGTEMQVDVLVMPTVTVQATNLDIRDLSSASDSVSSVVTSSALPTGASTLAEQQTQTASLSVLDDWDESDRAKVNPIVGQSGVQGGAGSTTALTQRIAIATDANAITAVGTVADDSTTPGAPVMVGGMAKSPDGTDPGSVSAENDVARSITDLNRRIYVNDNHPRTLTKHLDGSSAYTDESIAADPGDGFQIIITNIIASTGAATALNFFLEEGSTKIFGPIYLEAVAGRGFASGPIYLPVTASTAVTLTSSAAIAQSYQIQYFIQAV